MYALRQLRILCRPVFAGFAHRASVPDEPFYTPLSPLRSIYATLHPARRAVALVVPDMGDAISLVSDYTKAAQSRPRVNLASDNFGLIVPKLNEEWRVQSDDQYIYPE